MKRVSCLLKTIIMLGTILLSACLISTASGQEPYKPYPDEPRPLEDKQFDGTYVFWDKQQNTTRETWNWRNLAWEFGPYPNFAIFLQNGTQVTEENYIPLGVPFKVVIYVQKNIFTQNTTLGRAGLQWDIELKSRNGSTAGHANAKMVYINQMETKYWNESDAWHVESFVFNQSDAAMPEKIPDQPPPPPEKMRQFSFYHFDREASKVIESNDAWQIEFVGYFNDTTTPMGPYWLRLEITDQYDSWIDFGYRAWEGKMSPERMVAVGKPGFVYGGFRDTWTFEKLDMNNKPVYSVSKGALWKIRINVTSPELTNVTVGLDLGWDVKTFVNVTGWYTKLVTQKGGWMFNETSGTYYWNSTVEVTRKEEVYGPHLEERWINVHHGRQINVTREYWDPDTQQRKFIEETQWVEERMFLIYDHLTHSFEVKQGYSYWEYNPEFHGDRQHLVLHPLNTSDPTTRLYNLSQTHSSWRQVGPKTHVIEFVGSFSNTTYSDRDEYWLEINVNGEHGPIWANWEEMGPDNFQIAVDKLVAVSTIVDSRGRQVKGWMFQTDPGDFFVVQSKLYGASSKFDDIDGIGAVFNTGFGTWTENESYSTNIEIRLIKDLATNTVSSVTYNWTERNAYVYGPHLGWALVNVTDWHMEYNSTTGTWEWVESPQVIWNETIITDWHWEHYRMNQTEYARNPNSSRVWIDMQREWINERDPAFRMPESYAMLNSANISLVDGVVVVHLNVTFSPNAPESNYWWNMVFQNLTFSEDWSQGWGEHVVTEWTSEQVYYVNGTTTGGEAWYMSKPTAPLYVFYNGEKYLVEQLPYITIGGIDLPIKVRTQYDHWRQEEWKQYLFNDKFDPTLGMEPKYFELLNGTRIYVQEAFQAMIRTIQLNITDAYRIIDGNKVPLPKGTVFKTYMNRAVEDWSKRYWDSTYEREVVPFYYDSLNGTRIYRIQEFETRLFNTTTNRWDLSNKAYNETVSRLLLDYAGRGVTLNQTVVILREPADWQPLPDGTGYFLVMKNGTQIKIDDPWSVPDEERIVTIGGLRYLIGWPENYYKGIYEGQSLLIRGGGEQGYVHGFYYTDLGKKGGTKYELPYPGAMTTSWWDLEGIESEGHRLRTFKSLTINGTKHVLHQSEGSGSYYIVVNGEQVPVTHPHKDVGYYHSKINGDDYWNIVQNGWILRYGTYSDNSGQFDSAGTLKTTTGYDQFSFSWNEHNRYGYDRENATLYVQAPNGTRYDLHSEIYIIVWKVQVGDQIFYTADRHDRWEEMYDNETGQVRHMSYIMALNGSKIYFNWEYNPASWLEEIHIPLPGTNYTKLIPFNWRPTQVFDKLYVFNVTIPALPWDSQHTDVFYQNGTEVPVGTNFKVFGTRWGPGTRQNYYWEDDTIVPTDAFIPGVEAPWNNSKWVNYITALDGLRIFSERAFGWMGNRWGDPGIGELRQWNFINNDPAAGNRTAKVMEGGYLIYLNNTIKVDVTTPHPMGGWPEQYLIMKNGTYLSVLWREDIQKHATTINNKNYYFRDVLTYYNLTDMGIRYAIVDPDQNDPHQMLTPTVYQAPVASSDRSTWLWMNATSNSVLHDVTGYYLINASDLNRLNLQLVDEWWTLPEQLRTRMFMHEQENYFPRYNVTINGKEYFIIDPSPVIGRWDGEWTIEQSLYRYPKAINVKLDGISYIIVLFEEGGYWKPNLSWRRIETITLPNGSIYEVEEQHQWKPSFQVSINNQTVDVKLAQMNIYKKHMMWGQIYRWMLTDMNIFTQRMVSDVVVGTPEWGMWGIRAFEIVEKTGAVDLDGDLSTKDDQYFVRRIHAGSDLQNETIDRMWVEIIWDPNSSRIEDEIHMVAWMGKLHVSWTSEWNETYIWYYASNMTVVNPTTMQKINSTIVDETTGKPNPGYWDIAHMVHNSSWVEMLERAKREGWDWISGETNEWEWIWFGTQQDYVTSWVSSNGTHKAGIGLRYEFAGLSIYNNTQQTHFFMPKNIGNITFVTPGEAFGNMNATDEMVVDLNASITFGVAYNNINGTLFPFKEERSMWGWWDRPVFGADFDVPNFMHKPTRSNVDNISFTVHFGANATTGEKLNNDASIKIDQHIGNWDIEPYVIDGRKQNSSGVMVPLRGKDVFLNRSLATNYYVTAFTGSAWDIVDEKGRSVDNNNVTESERFSVASRLANASFATVNLGSTYDWGKPTTSTDMIRTFNVTSKTSPIGIFRASYQSESGKSSTGFDISAQLYFLTIGFTRWDGFAIYNDPEVSFLVSRGVLAPIGGLIPPWSVPIIVFGSIATAVAIVLIVFRRRVKNGLARLRNSITSTMRRNKNVPNKNLNGKAVQH